MVDRPNDEEHRSLISTDMKMPKPDTVSKIVRRMRALINRLLPVEVEVSQISEATSSIITPQVIESFSKCAGDFDEAVPFCLLRAKQLFTYEGYSNPADFAECRCRAAACEVLARRIIHGLPREKLERIMSCRFRYRNRDGGVSAPISCLETAIDQHCTIFLSSSESQHVVNSLWRGDWVQKNNEDDTIVYQQYEQVESGLFWQHMNPQRMGVPRYQTLFRQITWLVYLFVYSQAVQSPLDKLDPNHAFDGWEYVLYIMTASFLIEEAYKLFRVIRITPRFYTALGFWTIVNFITDALLLTAFGLRVAGIYMNNHSEKNEMAQLLRFRSFQVLSCAAPLIWIKLLTVFDGVKIIGTLQVVIFRMLRESAIFFILLGLMGIGFIQSLYALDAADGEAGGGVIVINGLIQALLGAPDFNAPSERFGYPFGLIVFYGWNFISSVILINVLIALFGSAYSDVEENATDEYLAFFANKTIDLIRAPDSYVYPAPFNLIEALLIAPLEWILPTSWYVEVNKIVMSTLFFFPLVLIALFESQISHPRSRRLRFLFMETPEDEVDPKVEDPTAEEEEGEISKVAFEGLIKKFPDTTITEGAVIDHEFRKLKEKFEALETMLLANGLKQPSGKEKEMEAPPS